MTSQNTAFGSLLRKQRLQQKLTLEEISDALYIQVSQLEALEDGHFEELPQYTFARGFAIKYAEYLELDTDIVAKKFDSVYPNDKRVHNASDMDPLMRSLGSLKEDKQKRKFLRTPLVFLASICVLCLAMFLIRMVNEAEDQHKEPKVVEENTVISSSEQREGASLDGTKQKTTGSIIDNQ